MREVEVVTRPRGLALRVCRWGDDGLPPLVILHGFLEQGAAWDAVARQLEGRAIYAPDQRGHGRSGHVGDGGFYHFWDYVADLDALVEQLGPVDLVGHSMGGTVASYYAGSRPERVRTLVLVEGLGPPDGTHDVVGRARAFLQHFREGRHHPVMEHAEAAAERMLRYNPQLGGTTALELAERVTQPVEGGVTWSWDPLHRHRSPTPFVHEHFVQFLRSITAPTLLVDGGASNFVFDQQVERRAALSHARRVVIEGAGHLVHHDDPRSLARVIQEHIDLEN